MKRILLVLLLAIGLYSCARQCSEGAVCGDFNVINGPSTVLPTPTPSVSPTVSTAPVTKACVLPVSTATACGKAEGQHGDIIANLASTLPNVFYTEASYVAALVQAGKDKGYCMLSGYPITSDEVAIKLSNEFSETYDVWSARNTPQVLYQQTCTPARF